MNIHHCVFKILGKNQSVTDGHTDGRTDTRMDGRTDGRTDNVKTVYPTTNKVCGGIKMYKSEIYFIEKRKQPLPEIIKEQNIVICTSLDVS